MSDGITDRAYYIPMLPQCFQNAKRNKVVGLSTILFVVAELLEEIQSLHFEDNVRIVKVELNDLPSFITEVKSKSVISTCIERCKLAATSDKSYWSSNVGKSKVQIWVTYENWKMVHILG